MEAVGIIKINRLINILNRQDNGISRTHRVCTAECVVKREIMFAVLRLVLIIPDILNQKIYDDIYIVTDEEALETAKELACKEGIMCGISSGTNVAAALKLAKKLGPGKTVVTVLPDTAERYFSTPLFENE